MMAYVGPMLAYIGPMLAHLGAYVGLTSAGYVKIPSRSQIFLSLEAKTTKKPRFLNIAKIKSVVAEGPETP